MKARVKESGEIVDVVYTGDGGVCSDGEKIYIWTDGKKDYLQNNLDFNYSDMPSEQRMRYEPTKAAMQGICARNDMPVLSFDSFDHIEAKICVNIADEIIKQLKE